MNHRWTLLAASAALLVSTLFANAEDWRVKYPELTFAVVPSENATGVIERYTPYMGYLSRQLGVKVNLRVASDYAAVIEGQRSGNIHIASYGSAAFARALITGVKTEAFALEQNTDGATGYYSVFYVLANSPYKTIADVKGKSLGLVDPNSTSGNNVPRLMLDKQGIDPEGYFGKVIFTGSHENAVVALVQGTIQVAANSWNAPNDSTLTRMIRKGMLKNADGSSMKYEDFRIIATSDPILNGPLAYLTDLPSDLKLAIEDAYFGARTNDPEAFGKLSDGKMARDGWTPARTEQWQPVVDLVKFVDGLRRKRS